VLSANVAITTANPVVTDASGAAGFQIVCAQPGPITATVTLATTQQPVQLPACVAP